MLTVYRELIALRRRYPDLSDPRLDRVEVTYGEHHIVIRRGRCLVVANFGTQPVILRVSDEPVAIIQATSDSATLVSGALAVPSQAALIASSSSPQNLTVRRT